ncbi:hypothetical protein GGI21_004963, partial [Coemansia aciculifera]
MFVRSQEDMGKVPATDTTAQPTQQSIAHFPQQQLQQSGVSGSGSDEKQQRYSTIAPRPALTAQQLAKPPPTKKKASATAKEPRRPAGAAKPTKPRAEKRKKRVSSSGGNIAAVEASAATTTTATVPTVSEVLGLVPPPPPPPQLTATGLTTFDVDDRLIQELLAGLPASSWLPTDPLTSDDWFMDPGSAVIAQSNLFPLAAQPPLPPSSSALSSLLDSTQCSANVAAKNTTLEAAAAGSHQASPDVRVLAGVRQKRDMPLLSGRPAKGNPLTGFAKKHGVGYAVGNQVAILSPALLSSSPPSAKQLRQNPYNYYSPPKPVPRNHVKIA